MYLYGTDFNVYIFLYGWYNDPIDGNETFWSEILYENGYVTGKSQQTFNGKKEGATDIFVCPSETPEGYLYDSRTFGVDLDNPDKLSSGQAYFFLLRQLKNSSQASVLLDSSVKTPNWAGPKSMSHGETLQTEIGRFI